jgi:hypothetical protein
LTPLQPELRHRPVTKEQIYIESVLDRMQQQQQQQHRISERVRWVLDGTDLVGVLPAVVSVVVQGEVIGNLFQVGSVECLTVVFVVDVHGLLRCWGLMRT